MTAILPYYVAAGIVVMFFIVESGLPDWVNSADVKDIRTRLSANTMAAIMTVVLMLLGVPVYALLWPILLPLWLIYGRRA